MGEKLDRLARFFEDHPKIGFAVAAGVFAVYALNTIELGRIVVHMAREVHRVEFAEDVARAASEALGG